MKKLLLLVVSLVGCASRGIKPVDVDKVPVHRPKNLPVSAQMTLAEANALGRLLADAQELLWPVEEGHTMCQYSPQAIGVTLFGPDAAGLRYVVVGYNPNNCPIQETYPILHRDLAYVLTPDGKLSGPRLRGR